MPPLKDLQIPLPDIFDDRVRPWWKRRATTAIDKLAIDACLVLRSPSCDNLKLHHVEHGTLVSRLAGL